ncbi:DDE-type integrase/transposase/recombinase [Microvirga tunisiensis]|uniref:DDE-type integrase/transposase/recombinase n=1 Tax=Microvirga tunisiensis TaxID=2108360 RepID=A0A5N7MWR0_9HYPH|nr:DDE-type integrase/transposase/recombinase [Microvirga tunisiensis]MPR13539.1 DDE-type integrase/transposase/recombinase [Microvirga tunisiensis]MPR31391.1 DDE-type integrase/transposase/recombinase [Microvirga tunisiensis]
MRSSVSSRDTVGRLQPEATSRKSGRRLTHTFARRATRLQNEGLLPNDVVHRTSKYLNNILEADHGALKRLIRPTRGFQSMKTAAATLTGFEIMRMIRRGHCILRQAGPIGEIRLVNQLFGLAA